MFMTALPACSTRSTSSTDSTRARLSAAPAALRTISHAAQLLCLLAALQWSAQAAAQNAAVPADSSSAHTLPEVTVAPEQESPADAPAAYAGGQVATGARMGLLGNKDFMETPFSTVSYTDTFVEDQMAQDISSVIAAADPAVFTNGSSGMINESYAIRGLNSAISDAAINGLYGVAPQWRTTPELFERIEVLKGPSALLNGMPPGGSVGGSVNMVTKRAGETPITRFTANYMSNSQFGGHIDIARRFGERQELGIRFNGAYRDGDGAVKHQKKEANLAALGLDWRSDRARVSADIFTMKDHVRGLNRGISLGRNMGIPTPPKANTLLNPTWTFTDSKDKAAIVSGEYDISQHLTGYLTYGVGKTDFDSLASSLAQVINDQGDTLNNVSHQRSHYRKKSAEAGLRGTFKTASISHQWGLSATHLKKDTHYAFLRNFLPANWQSNIYNPTWGPSPGTSFSNVHLPKTAALTMRSYGLVDTMGLFDDRLQVTLGIRRQEVVSDTFNPNTGALQNRYDQSATTPAAAVLWRLNPRVSLYANYVQGLTEGATAPDSAANAQEVFAPVKTRQKEVGIKFDLGEFAHTLSLYEIKQPSRMTDPFTNVFSYGGQQRNRGLEWSFFGNALPNVRLLGGIGYIQPKLTRTPGGANQGNLASGTPKWQGKLGAEWDVPALSGLSLTANASTMSKQYISADNHLSVAGRTIYDVGARYKTQLAGNPLTLRATVNNVTNKAYWASTLGSGLGAPRTVQMSATIDFQ